MPPPQSMTLHNFFTPAADSFKPGKAAAANTKGRQRSATNVPSGEIIVIDSDSDDEPTAVSAVGKKKKRRMSGSSADIEFVEQLVVKRPLLDQTDKPDLKVGSRQKSREKDKHGPVKPISSPISEAWAVFGQPSALLRSNSSSWQLAEGDNKPVPSFPSPSSILGIPSNAYPTPKTFSFGLPMPMLRCPDKTDPSHPSDLSNSAEPSSSDIYIGGVRAPSTPDLEMAVDIDMLADHSDGWGMGDDEMAFAAMPEEDPVVCPLCEMHLRYIPQSEIQDHVNKCLDSGGPTPVPVAQPMPPTIPSSSILKTLRTPHTYESRQLTSCHGESNASVSNAFSVLMSSRKENEAWKEASIIEEQSFRPTKGNNGGRRKAPFYKVLQGMPIAVDAFRYGTIPGVTAYFLTHAHSDHYTNLSSNWKSGPIYCSQGTANLIILMLSVDPKWVHPLPMDIPFVIPHTNGVRVTLIEANHCPGSCLFLFEGPRTVNAGDSAFKSAFVGAPRIFRYLHCGDFRASPQHVSHPAVKGKKIDHVYLDTTYLDPRYTFPPQPLVISACAELARRLISGQFVDGSTHTMDTWMTSPQVDTSGKRKAKSERMLFVVGTYSIGKERIVKAIAHALKSKVYCDARKTAILRCQDDPELDVLLTSNPLDASVHLVPLGVITSDKLKAYVEQFKGNFNKAVGFRPTGWTYAQPAGTDQTPSISTMIARSQQRTFTYVNLRPARNSTASLQLFPIPYSEHSSFFELTCFAMSLEWGKIIATVNVGSETSRGKMAKWVEKWEAERKKRGNHDVVACRQPDYW